jgi:hypothetical protein
MALSEMQSFDSAAQAKRNLRTVPIFAVLNVVSAPRRLRHGLADS